MDIQVDATGTDVVMTAVTVRREPDSSGDNVRRLLTVTALLDQFEIV